MEMPRVQVKRSIIIYKDFPGLGERIKKAREGDKRSLVSICKESGVSRTYWHQIENEATLSPITEDIVRKIEAALGVDLGVNFD
ncbi:helix-turn-helix transcriptional regulator [Nodularia sp. UHCC 0506]|uniref:helix-turn-helix domain-containing protein n=1 Tax=Nostocales TaxID=1161 RepID=UPI002B2161C1|nr:helix-turn-helix transcriptional regulator [Nodularia sp. UHCC 0506]MEA5516779.1 helix-turn-helix transcriptional regulator [Nodularia sp. UHCC 0506]